MRNREYIEFETLEKQCWSYLRSIKTAINYFFNKHFTLNLPIFLIGKIWLNIGIWQTLGFSNLKMFPQKTYLLNLPSETLRNFVICCYCQEKTWDKKYNLILSLLSFCRLFALKVQCKIGFILLRYLIEYSTGNIEPEWITGIKIKPEN
jgi:hypothetical protein